MKRARLLEEEVLYYLTNEWEDYVKKNKDICWLTTRAFWLKLRERGVLTTWPTLRVKLDKLLEKNLVKRINTSAGECWGPIIDGSNNNNN